MLPCRGLCALQHFPHLAESPVEVSLVDHERRSEPDDVGMCLLAEQAAVHQFLAIESCGAIEFNADKEALAANLLDVRAADAADEVHGVCAKFRGALGELLVD